MPKPKSQAQARLFGAIRGGKATKATGMSKSEAGNRLRGTKVKSLPKRAKRSKSKR